MSGPVPPRPDDPSRSPDRIPPPPDWGGGETRPDGTPLLAPAPWKAIETIPVFLIAVLTAGILAVPVALLPRRLCSARNILVTLIGELAFAGAVVLWVRRVKKAPVAALGLPRRPWGDVGAGIAGGAVLIVIGGIVGVIVNSVATRILGHSPTQPEQVASCVRGGGLVAMAPVVILAAPLGEETLFRGFLYRGLRRRFSMWPAAIISGVAFGAVHFAGLSFLLLIPPLIVVGMGLAWIYERRQSLLASMAAHATFNLVGILFIAANRR